MIILGLSNNAANNVARHKQNRDKQREDREQFLFGDAMTSAKATSGSAFDIDVQSGMVLSRFFGNISPSAVMSHMLAVGNDPRFVKGMDTLADLREARVAWNMQDIVEFRTLLFDSFQNRLSGRWALVTVPALVAGVTRLMENLFLRVDTRLFDNAELARRWLANPRRRLAAFAQDRTVGETNVGETIAGEPAGVGSP